jgi:hypothetical protein
MAANRRDERDGRENRGLGDDLEDGEIVSPSDDGNNALVAITKGEVDMQVSTAKKYPRSLTAFKRDALSMVTQDEDTAASCFYTLPRMKKDEHTGSMVPISGPSVRLAEIAACCWGNMRIEARPIEEGEKFVTAQGTAWDMEKNVLVRVETKRRITGKHGRFNDDMVANTMNSASSIAKRNAIFGVIPRSYIATLDKAARQCSVGDVKTLPERRERALAWYAKLGVTADRVMAALGRAGLDDITIQDLETMHGWRTALLDNATTVEEIFPPPAMSNGEVNVRHNNKETKSNEATEDAEPKQSEELTSVLAGIAMAETWHELFPLATSVNKLKGGDKETAKNAYNKRKAEVEAQDYREPGSDV